MGRQQLRLWSLLLLVSLFHLGFARADASILGRQTEAQHLDGTWRLESVLCADGSPGNPLYSLIIMDILGDGISLTLSNESCDLTIDGSVGIQGRIVTTEFSRGNWSSCSGSVPTYILNRFEYDYVRRKLQFLGNDLTPFASCQGKGGQLIFVRD